MRTVLLLIFIITLFAGCNEAQPSKTQVAKTSEAAASNEQANKFAIIIHGGAGTILKENMTEEKEKEYREVLERAVRAGYKVLRYEGESVDAVTKTISILEDSPLFNAGKGAVFNADGVNELDASIMDGKTLNAGAVAGVKTVKNPILAAKEVMTNSDHVMLAGEGAAQFAKERNLEIVDPSYFYTDKRMKSLEKAKKKAQTSYYDEDILNNKYGTVGCVALDVNGNIAAGTSTGGMTNKKWNRIGDSPIIGAGTYANNKTCGVSSTGWGEYFMRGMVAYDISAMMEYKGVTLKEATTEVIQNKLTATGGTGGVVALDHYGNMSFEFNTAGMYRASMDDKGELVIEIFK